jgi:hypothetical protein
VDGTIAVEARRLNQNIRGRDTPHGLEVEAVPFVNRLRKLMTTFGSTGPARWFTILRFKRPIPWWPWFEERLRLAFASVLAMPDPPRTITLDIGNVRLELVRRTDGAGLTFTLGATSDHDSGGWVVEELDRNLRLCIAEKTAKVAPYRDRYPEWWLLFVDMITPGLTPERIPRVLGPLGREGWHRIILVNPLDPAQHIEL